MRTRFSVLIISGLQVIAAQAADNHDAATQTHFAEPVIVIGDKLKALPQPSTPDTSRKGSATADTATLLEDLPGVNLFKAGGISSLPVIHGMADDRVRTLVNGMDLTSSCPNHMNPAMSYLNPRQVSDVQVFAGVTPVSVGGDSIGGSVVVETGQPRFASDDENLQEGEVGGFYRSNGHARGGHARATFATEQLSMQYDGATSQAANYHAADDFKTFTQTGRPDHTLPTDEVGSSAYESTNQTLSVALQQEGHLLSLQASHQNIPFENFPNQRMDMTSNKSDQFNLRYVQDQDWGLWRAQLFHESTTHAMNFGDDKRFWYGTASAGGFPCSPISMSCAAGMPMETEGDSTGVKLGADINLSERDLLRLGMEFLEYNLDDYWPPSGSAMWPGTFWNIRDGERDRLALFAEWEATFSEQWQSSIGLRHEVIRMDAGDVAGYSNSSMAMGSQYADALAFNSQNHQRSDENWDATFLVRSEPRPTIRHELALAQKTRSPNLYERYTWSTWSMAAVMNNFVGDGNGYVGTINLEPEVARTLSFTSHWHDAAEKRWHLGITPYFTRVENYIDAVCQGVCGDEQFNVLRYTNQTARLYGLDIDGQVLLLTSARWGNLTLGGRIDYTRGKNEDSRDDLYNIMPLNEKLILTHSLGQWSGSFESQHVSAKDAVSDMRNEIATQSYTLYHLRGRYEWQQVQLEVGVENLFDKFYSLPLGGAYIGQGTTMSLNGVPWGIAVPGPARSIYTALTIRI